MQKRLVALVVGACAVLAAAAAVSAQDPEEGRNLLGIFPSHARYEEYDIVVGVTATGSPRRPQRATETREVLSVPAHYGTLMTITGDPHTAVLWYRAEGGTIRNVVVDDVGTRGYVIRSTETTRIDTDER